MFGSIVISHIFLLSLLAWTTYAINEARIEFQNEAKVDVDVYWRNEMDRSYAKLASIDQGLKGGLNTFKGHQFLIAERGREVAFNEVPNFVMNRADQGMIIKDGGNKLLVLESPETRRKVGSIPRRPSNRSNVHPHVPAAKSELVVRNHASCKVLVWYLDNNQKQWVKVTEVEAKEERMIQTFRGHELYVARHDEAVSYDTHTSNYQVTNDFKIIKALDTDGTELDLVDDDNDDGPTDTKVDKQRIKDTINRCGKSANCIANTLFRPKISKIQKQMQAEITRRDELEEKYRDYVCMHHETLVPKTYATTSWTYDPDNEGQQAGSLGWAEDSSIKAKKRRQIKVDHYFEAPQENAKIYLVHNIISEKECQVMTGRATPRLAQASVTGDAPGEKVVSKARKAKSAMVKPDLNDPTDIIGDVQRRVFAFVNAHGGHENFDLDGQEPFNVIMYNKTGDEYKVHCDGYCDSSIYMQAGRAATVVLFCEEAARGGQTSFSNADLVLKGKAGQAAFFHYRNADHYMDSGWTKHSGCPVLEGTKWIATQWIREGVSTAHPWYHYTPTGDIDGVDMGRADPNF